MSQLGEILVRLGKLSHDDLMRAVKVQESTDEPLGSILTQLGLVSDRDKAQALALQYDVPVAGPEEFPDGPLLLDKLSPKFLREAGVLPLADSPEGLVIAMADPSDQFAIEAMRLVAQKPVLARVAAREDILAAIERFYAQGKSALERIVDDIGANGEEASDDDIEHLRDLAREAPVVRLVNQFINDAVNARASDIHVEPFHDELKVRYRIDGVLRELQSPPARLSKAIVSRIKILSRLNIAERRLPQDGRARVSVQGRQIDMRVSTMPTIHGESVVIRLLDDAGMKIDFSALGLAPGVERGLRRLLATPNGMMLVTGPTGSGKTTTLYAALHLLNVPDRKIITVEDPIEYQIRGINQIQVKPQIGLDFANVLRSIVRHDPDVIMVGEMRDYETAEIAIHAALTGHLVLSTLHTNSAAGSITRLLDMGVDSFLLTSTVRAVIGQRLVRILCPACREAYPAPPEILAQARERGLVGDEATSLYRAVGCAQCGGIGYQGRIGIFELLEMTDEIRDLTRREVATAGLEKAMHEHGVMTMFDDGLRKSLEGVTTLEEVRRATEET